MLMSRNETPAARVKVMVPFLNIRTSADAGAAVCGLLEQGAIVAITENVSVGEKTWGRIKPSKHNVSGWIALGFTEKL